MGNKYKTFDQIAEEIRRKEAEPYSLEDLWWDFLYYGKKPFEWLRYDLVYGIENLWIWFPVIWKSRTWDWYHLATIMQRQLELTAEHTEKYGLHVDSELDARDQRICVELLDRLAGDKADYPSAEVHPDLKFTVAYKFRYTNKTAEGLQDMLFKLMNRKMRAWWI